MLHKKYLYELPIAPVKITWSQELVDSEEDGSFYLRLTPHVEWGEEFLEKRTSYIRDGEGTPIGYRHTVHYSSWDRKQKTKLSPGALGAMKRNRDAMRGQKIFNDLKKEWTADVQKKLRTESNKRRGQRWNKKV